MKILHITPHYEPAWHLGGVVRSVSQLCRGLAALGHEVTVFTTDSGRDRRLAVPVDRPVEVGGVTVYYFRAEVSLKFAYSRGLAEACRRLIKGFDITHLASIWGYPGIPAARAARRHGIPYVISPHGTLLPYSLAQKSLKKKVYLALVEQNNLQGAHAMHYTTALERDQMASFPLAKPSFIVPNGLDLGEFDQMPPRHVAREMLGISPEDRVILYVGRLHARKGLDLMLSAIALKGSVTGSPLLLLAGPDDGYGETLRVLAKRLKVNSRVRFPGYISPEERNVYLRAADLAVLVSRQGDNFGIAPVEAMLAGVPVLLSEHVGICREVAAAGAGVVVPLRVSDIADALEMMLGDPEGLRVMGRRAAAAARERYDLNLVARQMATAYEDILTARRSPAPDWLDG